MIPQQKKRVTPEEYLLFEKDSEIRHEYFDGEIFAMVGARHNHTVISSNIVRELGNLLKETSCMVFAGDKRIKIEGIEKYTYPDVVVACDKMELLEDELDSLLNPVVIIEILSDSTEAYDRGLKFTHYQLIPSLEEYILVSQYSCDITKFKKINNKNWIYTSYTSIEQSIKIESIACEIPLAEIYYKVKFR
ncbi:conserved hypothetical protein [Desulfamplus magnetovallimortis]|uniref:Putative restriction endonuclease domain-containing protein n=1 Tax=Desulfamplus magnetovallimortis TaxID=1246637 RepID=A0A1W1H785_9BACT|nr:Uma2 family endonuclease [Desulfamplus magnetovallimortis]SLM28294.1 conserved hypothetical protein [Desulfamplus magnetovallimortis]